MKNYINNQYFGLYKPIKWFNMITKKQLGIFEVFAKGPFAEYTRKEIKKQSKEKSNNAMALAINALKKENVIIEKKIGRTGTFKLNLNNDLTFYYIALCNDGRLPHPAKLSLETLKTKLTEHTPFYSAVVFGSYAVGKEKKGSDIDVAIFIESDERKKEMEAIARNANLKSVLEMDVHVITRSEMVEMLTRKEENLGKQIARKHLARYNHRIFYEIIKEGIDHGFHF